MFKLATYVKNYIAERANSWQGLAHISVPPSFLQLCFPKDFLDSCLWHSFYTLSPLLSTYIIILLSILYIPNSFLISWFPIQSSLVQPVTCHRNLISESCILSCLVVVVVVVRTSLPYNNKGSWNLCSLLPTSRSSS